MLAVLAQPAEPPEQPEPPEQRFAWSAPAECPTAQDVLDRSRALGLTKDARVAAEAEVTQTDGGFELRVTLDPDTPPRVVRDADCSVLADAAALMVALSADPVGVVAHVRQTEAAAARNESESDDRSGPARAGTSGSESESEPESEPEPEPEPDPEPERAKRSGRVRFGLRLAGGLGGGALPGVNPGASVGLAAFGAKTKGWTWRIEAGWLHWFPRRKQFENFDEVTGDFRLTGGYLRAGPSFRWRTLSVPIQAGLDLGALTALTQTQGFPDTRGPTQLWAAATLGPALTWEPASPLSLWLGVDMVVPLRSYAFAITGLGVLHEVWPVGVRSLLGIEIRFP
jgi:hypothetical protein